MKTIAERLTTLRENKGWSKTLVAKKLGLQLGTYANWEYGTREPDVETIKQIAKLYGVSTDYLLGNSNKKYWEINEKEEKDIAKQVEEIIEGMQNDADINFYGEPMTEEDKMLLATSLELGLRMAKEKSKKKFTPKKYRNQEEEN